MTTTQSKETTMPVTTCECTGCGCDEPATTTDDSGAHVCEACADYYVTDGGTVVCSREQDESTCRHCDEAITWGRIQTGQPGAPNWREGRCPCREWTQTEAGPGSPWELRESDLRDDAEPIEYSVLAIDSEQPARWMRAEHVTRVRPGGQDETAEGDGRCRYSVWTTDPVALEAALDADDDVLQYGHIYDPQT